MPSGEYSEKPLPPSDKKICPYCGERNTTTARACWLCLKRHAIREGEPTPSGRARPASDHRDEMGDSAAWAAFGVLSVFLICALAFEVPGVLFILLILVVPAYVRAQIALSPAPSEAAAWTPKFLLVFLNSLGIVTLVGLASFIAFYVTCLFSMVAAGGAGDSLFTCSIFGGVVAGLMVFALLFRFFWPRKEEA